MNTKPVTLIRPVRQKELHLLDRIPTERLEACQKTLYWVEQATCLCWRATSPAEANRRFHPTRTEFFRRSVAKNRAAGSPSRPFFRQSFKEFNPHSVDAIEVVDAFR
jgi:hypothetical protein